MKSFDVKFELNYSGEKKVQKTQFGMTLSLEQHNLYLGEYVIYPRIDNNELMFIPKFKFRAFESRFQELYKKNSAAEREKADNKVKQKNRKYTMTSEEIRELHKLRGIITNSRKIILKRNENDIKLPYGFLEMLNINIKEYDILTFIPVGKCEFIIVNPEDAWRYSSDVYSEYSSGNYSHDENTARNNIISRIRKAI